MSSIFNAEDTKEAEEADVINVAMMTTQ